MKKIRFMFFAVMTVLIFSVAVSGASAVPNNEIVVSAAVSLKNAFEEIGKIFESKNGVKAVFNFGASGDLAQQIVGGAPVDVFASAAQKDMDGVEAKGLLVPHTRVNFAGNSVVLAVPLQGASLKAFDDLKSVSVKKIAVGNPKTVPAGRYAAEVLDYYKLSGEIKDKLVFTENVRQALDYVARGEVDAGIVYATDAAVRAKEVKVTAVAPGNSHKPVVYPLAVVKGTKNEAAAKAFISLVLSQEGAKILERYGFRVVK